MSGNTRRRIRARQRPEQAIATVQVDAEGLVAAPPARWKRTTLADPTLPVAENLLNRQFSPEAPNQVWAADITYVRTQEGWLYLAAVIDLCSRKIVGWATADHLRSDLPHQALSMALLHRQPPHRAG